MEEEFLKIYYPLSSQHQIALSIDRAYSLWQLTRSISNIEGGIAELGVYKGGSALLLASAVPEKELYLFDTFTGLPDVSDHDFHTEGDFSNTNLEQVQKLLAGKQVSFHPGRFPESFTENAQTFALVHLDADLYQSTLDGLRTFWPKLTSGGYIVCDDYEWPHCPGVKPAVNEFTKEMGLAIEVPVKYQCLLRKP